MTYGGPRAGSCACWHVRGEHPRVCADEGCGCPRFTLSLFAAVSWALSWLRGVR